MLLFSRSGLQASLKEFSFAVSATQYSLHILVEEGDEFVRMPPEVVIAVLKASCSALDPKHFLFFISR